ncbi:nucleotide-diphospho-sugar transferase [Chryseolinea sp. H1M3-3]|uniref:nucleotide-diphospho-sugar transferase n=1 Tax=Chryseolinea sp. H1M3-3 TaxID=3034144 RepID=UPI0023EB0B20|nr:nucleotide-diphospho-sugar transferase [Chryseolinea sp. H1M3-3]
MAEFVFKTPVLLLIFNRPETTKIVFDEIRKIRPARLYVAADGPREGIESDKKKCADTRKIIENIDWPCEVKKLFQEHNLNRGKAASTALTWFFSHEEEGIILEDDSLPLPGFFRYCQELLEDYRDDNRIMHIGGRNFLGRKNNDSEYSYYFSTCGYIGGWATWRRAWETFDYDIRLYDRIKQNGFFENYFLNPIEKTYRLRRLDSTLASRGKVDWWDCQWDFARYINSGLAIVPNRNLVRDIGTKDGVTHRDKIELTDSEMEFPLKHPPFVIRDLESDKRYFFGFMKRLIFSKFKI